MLAGDAAHVMPPFMGQGMCSGIRDAWNLSWRLDLLLRGLAEDSLLDSYTLERKPQIRAVIEASMAMGKVVCVSDPVKAAERDAAYLSGNVAPLPPFPGLTDGLLQKDGQLRGILGVHGSIEIGGKVSRYDEVIGRGFHLLVRGDQDPLASLTPEQQSFIHDYDLKVVRLAQTADSSKGIYRDVSGKYLRFMAEAGLKASSCAPTTTAMAASQSCLRCPNCSTPCASNCSTKTNPMSSMVERPATPDTIFRGHGCPAL